jgi:hypothetical protein
MLCFFCICRLIVEGRVFEEESLIAIRKEVERERERESEREGGAERLFYTSRGVGC